MASKVLNDGVYTFVSAALLTIVGVVICFNISSCSSQQQDYCRICTDHTMCKFQSRAPGPMCTDYQPLPLTAKEKVSILHDHNFYRSIVASGNETRGSPGPQPSASNMAELTWDTELEEVAQRWADQCMIDDHDACRDVARFHVGQNMLAGGDTGPVFNSDVPDLVQKWYDEVDIFDSSVVQRYHMQDPGKPEWGHYTQVVWAKTTKVGCGRSLFHSTESGYPVRMEFLVCNYGPGGNFNGRVVYKSGTPASECRSAVPSRKYPGLCEISKEEEDVQLIINQRHKKKKSSFIWRKKMYVGAPGLGPIKTFTVDQTASGKTNYSIMTGSHVAKDYNTFLGMFMDGHGKIAAKNVLNTLGIPYKTTINENDNPNVPIIVAELPSPADIVETLQSKKQFRKFQRKAKFLKKLLGSDRSVKPVVPQVNSLQTNNYGQISGNKFPYVGAFNKSPFNSIHPISVPPVTAPPQLIHNVYTNPSISQPHMISNVFNSPPSAVTISHPHLVANIFNKPVHMSTSPPQYNTNHFNSELNLKPNVIANIFKNPLSTFQPQQVSNNFNYPAKFPSPQPNLTPNIFNNTSVMVSTVPSQISAYNFNGQSSITQSQTKLIPNVFNNPSVLSSPKTQLGASTFTSSHGNTLYPYTFSNMYQNTPLQPKVISNIFQSTVTPSFNQPQTATNIFKTSHPQIIPNIFQSAPMQNNFQPQLNTNVYNNPQTITNMFNNPNSLIFKHPQPAENSFVKPMVSQPQVIHNIFDKVNSNNQGQQLVPNVFGNGMSSLGSQPLLVTNIFSKPQPQLLNSYSMNAAPAPDLSDSENTSKNVSLLSSISSTPHSNVLSKPSSNIFSKPFSKPSNRSMNKYTKDNVSTFLSSSDPTIIFTTTYSGHETLTPFTHRTVVENISLCAQTVLENIKNNIPKEICKSKVVGNTTLIECSSRSEQSSVNRVSYYNKNKENLTSDITSISKMVTNTTTNLTRVPSGLLNVTSVLKVDINSTIKLPVIVVGHRSTRSNFTKTSNAEQRSMDNIMSDSYSGENIITNATVISQSNTTITHNITSFLIARAFIQSYAVNVTRFENKIHKSLIKCADHKQSNVYATTENIKNYDKTQASLTSNVSITNLSTSNIKLKDERTISNFNTTETIKDNFVKPRSYDGLALNDTAQLPTNDFDINYYNPEDNIATSFRQEPSSSFYDRELLDNASKLLQNFHNELYIFATPLQLMSTHASLKHTKKNISRLIVNNNNKVYIEKPHLPKRQNVKKFSHSINGHKGNIRPRISLNLESDDLPYNNRTHLLTHASKRQGKRKKKEKISQEKLIKEEKVIRRESNKKHFVIDNVPIKVEDLGSKFRFTSTNSTEKDKVNISQQNVMRHKPRLVKDTKMQRSFIASHDKYSSHKDQSSLIPLDLSIGPIKAENDKEKSIRHHEQHSNMLTMLNKENGSFSNDKPEERNLSQAAKLPILTTHNILSYISLKSDTKEPEAEQIPWQKPCYSNTSCNSYKKIHSHDLNNSYLSHKTQSSILPADSKNNYHTSETDSYGLNEINAMVSKLKKKFKQNDSHALPWWKNLFYITPVDSALNSRQYLQPNKRRHNESCPCEQENEFLNHHRVKNDHQDMLSKSNSNLKFTKDHYLKKRSVNIENVNNQSDFEKSQSRHELFDVKRNIGTFETNANLTKGYKEDTFTVAKYVPEHTTFWKHIVSDGLDLLNFLNDSTPTILNDKSKVLITNKQITPEFYISSNNLGIVSSHILAISNKNTSSSNFNKIKYRVDDHITLVNENDSSVRFVYPNEHYKHILDENEKENISNSNTENVSNDSNLEKSQVRPEIFDAKWNIGAFETNLNLTKGDKEGRFIIAKDVPEHRTLWKYKNLDEDNIMNYPKKSTPLVLDDQSKFLITKEEIAPEFKSSNSERVSSRMLPIAQKNSFSSNFNPWKYRDKDRIVIVHENDSSVRVVYPNGHSIHFLDEDEKENTSYAIVKQTVTPISFTPNRLKISKPVSGGSHIVHKINRGSFSYGTVPQGMDPLGENSPNLFAMSKKDRIAQLLKFGTRSQSETRMKYSQPVRTKPLKEKSKINFNRPILRNVPLTLYKTWDNFPQEMKIDYDETNKIPINETIKSVNDSNIRIKPINKKLTNNDNDKQPINQRGRRGWKLKKYITQTKILPDSSSTVPLHVQNVDVFMNRPKLKPGKPLENVVETLNVSLQKIETPSETDNQNKIILKQNVEDFEKDEITKIFENKTRQFYIPQTNVNTHILDSINSTITNKRYKVTNIQDTNKIPAISSIKVNSPKEIENMSLFNPNVDEQNYMKQMIENNNSRQYIANLLKNQSTTQDLINYYINYNRTITFPGYNLNNDSANNVNISTHPQSVSKINYVAMSNISCKSPEIYLNNNNTMCGNRTLNDHKDYLVIYHPSKNNWPLSTGLLETIEPESLVGGDGNRDKIKPMKDNISHDSDTNTTFKKSFGMNDKIFFGKSSSKHITGSSNISSISNKGDSVDNKYLYSETRNIQINNDKPNIFEVNSNDHESHGNNSLSDFKIYSDNQHRSNTNLLVRRNITKSQYGIALKSNSSIRLNETNNTIYKQGDKYKHNDINHNKEKTIRNENKSNNSNQTIETAEIKEFKNGNNSYLENKTLNATTKHKQWFLDRNVNLKDNYQSEQDTDEDNTNENITEFTNMYSDEILTQIYTNKTLIKHSKNKNKTRWTVTGKIKIDKPTLQASSLKHSFKSAQTTSNHSINGSPDHYKNDDDIKLHKNSETIRKNLSRDNNVGFGNKITTDNSSSLLKKTTSPIKINTLTNEINKTLNINHNNNFLGNNKISVGNKNHSTLLHITLPDKHIKSDLVNESKLSLEKSTTTPTNINLSNSGGIETSKKSHEIHHTINTYQGHTNILNHESTIEKYSSYETKRTNSNSLFMSNSKNLHTNSKVKINKSKTSEMMDRNKIPINSIDTSIIDLNISNINSSDHLFNQSTHLSIEKRPIDTINTYKFEIVRGLKTDNTTMHKDFNSLYFPTNTSQTNNVLIGLPTLKIFRSNNKNTRIENLITCKEKGDPTQIERDLKTSGTSLSKGKSAQATLTMQSNEIKDGINHENESDSTVWTTHKESRRDEDTYINKINNETHKIIENYMKQSATSNTQNTTDEDRKVEDTEKRLITNSNKIKEEPNVETSTNERFTEKRPHRRKRKKQYLMIKEPDFKNVPLEEVVVQLLKL